MRMRKRPRELDFGKQRDKAGNEVSEARKARWCRATQTMGRTLDFVLNEMQNHALNEEQQHLTLTLLLTGSCCCCVENNQRV